MKLRVRPKSDYLNNASIGELHKINLEWESEIKLWQDELNFFQRLIDKYIMNIVGDLTIEEVQGLVDKIIAYNDTDMGNLMQKVKKHEGKLESLLEDPFSHDEAAFRNEHDQLEEEVTRFMLDFKQFKLDIFSVIDEVLKLEKHRHVVLG